MQVCLRMDELPTEQGWTSAQAGEATYALETDELAGNQALRFTTAGSEGAPGPVASFSVAVAPAVVGRFVFDLRLAEVGPYSQFTLAELDFGERILRFHLRNLDASLARAVLAQLVLADRSQPVWERAIAAPETFQTSRLIEVAYDLREGKRAATILLEGSVVEQDLALDESWTPGTTHLRIGAFDYVYPTSGAVFELDNVGFDDRAAP